MKPLKLALLTIALAGALTACSSASDNSNVDAKSNAPGNASPAKPSKPFTAADVKVQLAPDGAVSLNSDGSVLHVPVSIDNQSSVDLDSSATPPVNIGAHLLDSSGAVSALDLVHASLGDIPAGAKKSIVVDVPATRLADHALAIVPVQEGVAWFDTLGVTPLKVGPFKSCQAPDHTDALCSADGALIPKQP
jgi:hypothetical protein